MTKTTLVGEPLGRASDLALLVGGVLYGPDIEVKGVGSLSQAEHRDLAFADAVVPEDCCAGVLLIGEKIDGRSCIVVDDPKAAFVTVLERFFPSGRELGIHPTAVVHPTARIGADVYIGPYVVIGSECVVGARSILHPNVVLYARTIIGEDVVIHSGTVVGADGFSYLPGPDGLRKVPHIGRVRIEDGVEIGANSCVDRAFIDETRIGVGAKIDNLVQVGHNSKVGKHAVLAAQTGLSGSVKIGDRAMLGGQVGVADHVQIGSGARVGAKSGVSRELMEETVYLGKFPAQEAGSFRRVVGSIRKLPDLWKRLRRLEQRVGEIERSDDLI